MKKLFLLISFLLVFSTAYARDHIFVVGSSTVYPFTTSVAENFSRMTDFSAPKVESTGTGGGFKLFCAGVGIEHPDVSNASRAVKKSEIEKCAENGVTDMIEVKIGFDGIVVANSKQAERLNLTLRDIFFALAKDVPRDGEKTIPNPYRTWRDVNPALPAVKIEVLGPPPTSGTRDAFAELAMEGGCKTVPWIKELKNTDKNAYKALCHTIREDGAYVEAGENDNLIVQKLLKNKDAVGVFGFSFLDANVDRIQGAIINDVAPEFETIADGSYLVSRPLFIYIKKQHIGQIPGLKEFMIEYLSDKAIGEDGYLSDKGLIPLPKIQRDEQSARILK